MSDNVLADPEFARQWEAIRKQAQVDASLIDRLHTAEAEVAILRCAGT